jgi:acyl-CoA dehydrogenase
VPFARDAGRVVALARTTDGPVVVVVPSESAVLVLGRSLAGEPRDEVRFDDTPLAREALAPAPAGLTDPLAWLYDGALMRSAQIVGALEAALEASVAYANERVQFGRPIGRFQAIQHQLAQFGGEVAASSAALDRAVQALERQEPSAQLAIAAAKARASEAAGVGAAIAHQVHGAIGFSRAFALQRLTRRLWSWREEYGSEGFWHQRLAARLLAAPDGPWLALAAV